MGNLTFRNLRNSLIINNIHRITTCRLSENWRVSPCRTTASSVSEPNLTSGCIAPMSARITLLQVPELLFLLFPVLICSWHFHGQKYGTAKNASIRNRGDAYENLSWICVTGNNGFVESAWMFSFLQCDVYWMTGPPFLCESESIDKATSLWRLLIEVADGWFGKDRFVCFRTTCTSGFGTYCWMSMR